MTSASDELSALRTTIALELDEPVRPNVEWLASEIASSHGETVLGVLFYGSGLRDQTDDGVLDFWVVVDDYRLAYQNGLLAFVNRVAPPNVFYLEREHDTLDSHEHHDPPDGDGIGQSERRQSYRHQQHQGLQD